MCVFPNLPPAGERLLFPYLSAAETFRCPADCGADMFDWRLEPTIFDTEGCSYRFNGYLPNDYQTIGVAEDPTHNLGARKEWLPPVPSRFIMLHEFAAYPFDYKGIPSRQVAPTLFIDGHSQQCDFTANIRRTPVGALSPAGLDLVQALEMRPLPGFSAWVWIGVITA